MRWLHAVLLVAALLSLSSRANASEPAEIGLAVTLMVGGPITGVNALVFGIADLVYAGRGSWLPRGWATAQILVGGGLAALGASLVIANAVEVDGDSPKNRAWKRGGIAFSVANFALAAWFITHGALSLWRYKPPPPPSCSDRCTDEQRRCLQQCYGAPCRATCGDDWRRCNRRCRRRRTPARQQRTWLAAPLVATHAGAAACGVLVGGRF